MNIRYEKDMNIRYEQDTNRYERTIDHKQHIPTSSAEKFAISSPPG